MPHTGSLTVFAIKEAPFVNIMRQISPQEKGKAAHEKIGRIAYQDSWPRAEVF
jgi:hypothetical protein